MASTIATIMKALGKLRKKPKKTEADRKEIRQLEREKDQINKILLVFPHKKLNT